MELHNESTKRKLLPLTSGFFKKSKMRIFQYNGTTMKNNQELTINLCSLKEAVKNVFIKKGGSLRRKIHSRRNEE